MIGFYHFNAINLNYFLFFFFNFRADKQVATALYNLPVQKTTIPTGHCGNGTEDQAIVIGWPSDTQNKTNSFALTFHLSKPYEFELFEVAYEIFAGDLPKGNNDTLKFYHVGSTFSTPTQMSYHCTKVQSLNLTSSENGTETVGHVLLSQVQLEAYHQGRGNGFSAAIDCDAINTPGNDISLGRY